MRNDDTGRRVQLAGSGQPLRHGPPSLIKFRAKTERPARDGFQLNSAKPRDDLAPLANRGWRDPERPGDIRGTLKVINNVLLQHARPFTKVKDALQPKYSIKGLTLVDMDKFATMADRINAAMKDAGVKPGQLAKACGVSAAAVTKWRAGGKLSADNLSAAARALGVREEWLRTGRLPRERDGAEEDRQVDRVVEILQGLKEPLAALAEAIDQLQKTQETRPKERKRAGRSKPA